MKQLPCLTLIAFFAIVLGACAKTPKNAEEMINPGDKIGDFLITTGVEGEFLYPFDLSCSESEQGETKTFICKSFVGKTVNITTGLYDDTARSETPTEKLNEYWSDFNYELFVEDRPVNLQAFGYIETIHPVVGVVRFWNVVVVTDKPGKMSVRDSGIAGGDPLENTATYIFNAP